MDKVFSRRRLKMILAAGTAASLLSGCGRASTDSTTSGEVRAITGPNTETDVYKPTPLLWEGANPDGVLWSAYVYQIIGSGFAPKLFSGTEDVADFCANYPRLTDSQKANFWAYLISAVAQLESRFDPSSQSSTRKGLLRLDDQTCGSRDNELANPLENLACGVGALARQIQDLGKIAPEEGSPFEVLNSRTDLRNVIRIERLTQNLKFCQPAKFM
jgi:hypothetical protein